MERLVRIAAMLQAHPEQGVPGDTLSKVAGFDGGADAGTQLKREIRHLERQGWQIENIAPAGATAVYRLTTVDNRLRVRLSPGQQAALRRAVLLADRVDLVQRLGLPDESLSSETKGAPAAITAAAPDALSLVVDAVRDHQVLRFGYKGTPRVVHPESVRNQGSTWYVRGVEAADLDDPVLKVFVVSRMVDADADAPGTAQPVPTVRHPGLHPMSWEIDPPVDVTLEAPAHFDPDVRRWLGEPLSVEPSEGERVRMVYRVTHRAALRTRLFELGERVRVVGPDDVRAEVIAALDAARGETVPA
ncbi:WYL domain-containing protein [Nocardioides sp. WS12]|uniref:WYL domain-containing protein n=1 Tax=Nocardioides sp. WS12 TaxID=2486272 RepID=UPI0015FAD6F0|nr:WYL domain-containing protein [Nocardioides sp. WS12]